jgi:hypothetical protein
MEVIDALEQAPTAARLANDDPCRPGQPVPSKELDVWVRRCVNLAFRKTRPFFLLTSVVVVISLFEAYQVGVIRGFRDWLGQESYGRVLFAVGAAITQMQHGGYGFSVSSVIERILLMEG